MSNRLLTRWKEFSARVIGLVLGTAAGLAILVLAWIFIPIIVFLHSGKVLEW